MTQEWTEDKNFVSRGDAVAPDRTDDELLEILSNHDRLNEINKKEGPAFFEQLFTRMTESEEFLKRVDEVFSVNSTD